MRAVITVVGKDTTGIIAKVSGILFENGANILDISQSVFDGLFVMVMLCDVSACKPDFYALSKALEAAGNESGLKIHAMHEDIFNAMHRVDM